MTNPQPTGHEAAAIALLEANLHALPNEEFGHINMLPFAFDSPQSRQMKQLVATGVVRLLATNGFLANPDAGVATADETAVNNVVVCRLCGTELINASEAVNPATFIAGIANLNPQCPHAPMTFEDHRRRMEANFYADPETKKAMKRDGLTPPESDQ